MLSSGAFGLSGTDDDLFEKMLDKALNCSKKAYEKMSQGALQHVKENYNFETFENKWVNKIDEVIEKHGSWQNRKNYSKWTLKEVA